MKKVLIVLAALALLAVGGVLVLLGSLDSIVKNGVERIGSDATKAPVTLDTVEISLQSGKGSLRGFTLGNPEGFATDSAIRLGEISVEIDPSTVASDTVVIKNVLISGPEITYEISGMGTESNIGAIRENVDAYVKSLIGESKPTGGEGGGGGGDGGKTGTESSGGKKIVIENLRIEKGQINVSATFLGGKKLGAALPAVTLTDLGKDEGGLTPEEVGAKILDALTAGVGDVVSGLGLDKLAKGVKDAVGGAVEGVKGLFGK